MQSLKRAATCILYTAAWDVLDFFFRVLEVFFHSDRCFQFSITLLLDLYMKQANDRFHFPPSSGASAMNTSLARSRSPQVPVTSRHIWSVYYNHIIPTIETRVPVMTTERDIKRDDMCRSRRVRDGIIAIVTRRMDIASSFRLVHLPRYLLHFIRWAHLVCQHRQNGALVGLVRHLGGRHGSRSE